MRLATYVHGGVEHAGVVAGDLVHPFGAGVSVNHLVELGLAEALRLGEEALDQPGVPLADVRLLAPLRPTTMRDFVAFEEHVEGVRRSVQGVGGVPDAWYDAPTFYFTNPHTVLGPDEDVAFPQQSVARDFELEVAAVIGRAPTSERNGGRSLRVEEARDHVFGYTILNDWSARDLQRREMEVSLGPAKGKDFANTLGPWLVTADELEPYRDPDGFLALWCTASVNGSEVGADLLSNMGWTFESMVAYASRDSRVLPGDVLGSGTTGHGGCLAELWGRTGSQDPPPLQPGDLVTLTVEGIGVLRSRVTSGAPTPPIPPVRRRSAEHARREHDRPTADRR